MRTQVNALMQTRCSVNAHDWEAVELSVGIEIPLSDCLHILSSVCRIDVGWPIS